MIRALIAIAAAVLGAGVLGATIGLGQFRMWQSAFKGFVVGAVGGVAILCVYVAPASIDRTMAAAGVLLFATILVRARAD